MKYVKLIHATPMNPIESFEGEFIEEKVARVVENKEPIEDGAPIIYTERKDLTRMSLHSPNLKGTRATPPHMESH